MREIYKKQDLVTQLLKAVRMTRAGADIIDMTYDDERERVTIHYANGYKKGVNVACDSGIALIEDVTRAIN